MNMKNRTGAAASTPATRDTILYIVNSKGTNWAEAEAAAPV